MALSLKVGDEFGNFDDLKKKIKVYITILRNILCNVLYNCYTCNVLYTCSKYSISVERALSPVACPGIRKGGGGENLKGFFFLLFNFSREGSAQKIADKIIFPTKKVAKYR